MLPEEDRNGQTRCLPAALEYLALNSAPIPLLPHRTDNCDKPGKVPHHKNWQRGAGPMPVCGSITAATPATTSAS